MRRARLGSMIVLFCGVVMAGGAFAAEPAQPASSTAAETEAKEAAREAREAAREAKEAAKAAKEAKSAAEAPKEAPKAGGALSSLWTKLAPKFGGDANIEYDTRDSNFGDGLTSRVRLTMDADIDPRVFIHTRLTAKQYVYGSEHKDHPSQAAGYENEAVKVGMEQLYLGARLGDAELRVGRQPLWLANGMLADINGINGVNARASLFGVNAMAFFGREGTQALQETQDGKSSNLGAVELGTSFGPVGLGATFLKVHDAFYSVNASYATPIKLVLFGQFGQNVDAKDEDKGYWAGVRYGNAGKQGEWDASAAYLRIEGNMNPNGKYFVNDGNWIGAKGVRIKAHYAVTDWSTLVLVQDFFRTTVGNDQHKRTDVEFEVRF